MREGGEVSETCLIPRSCFNHCTYLSFSRLPKIIAVFWKDEVFQLSKSMSVTIMLQNADANPYVRGAATLGSMAEYRLAHNDEN